VPAATTCPTSASGRHHAIDIGYQRAVAGLVGLATISGLRGVDIGLRSLEAGILGIEHGSTDEVLGAIPDSA
jgi:hypothetical protein